jgi:hypothetical protein
MLGFVTGEMPGPYKTIGRMNIRWYRFVRPDGSEFNFPSAGPFAADSQGRMGVPGRGSTDYIEEFFMPMLTALVPAAINMIAPISDRFVNQIDLDNNTVTQTGVARSSELAKNEIITAWNRVAQKLAIDMMDNMTPPFSIAAGTRITVFSPTDLIINYCDPDDENCGLNDKIEYAKYMDAMSARAQILRNPSQNEYASWVPDPNTVRPEDIGQVRGGFDAQGNLIANDARAQAFAQGMQQYQSQTAAQYNQYYQQQANASTTTNQNNLGLQYNASGQIIDPFASAPKPVATTPAEPVGLLCEDSTPPDINGCCTGEIFTDMAEQGWNCCPAGGGDCFPPLR